MPSYSLCYQLVHQPSGRIVADVQRLETWWEKGRGVIGMPELRVGYGVWLPGVSAVHTLFVRFPLDLLFLNADLRTIASTLRVAPWQPLVRASGAAHTIELGSGTLSLAEIQIGDLWALTQTSPET